MTRHKLTIGIVAAAFTLSAAPAVWAQAGSRPNTTGSSSGSAAPRGGGSSSSGSSSAGSSSSSGSSSSGGSMDSGSSSSGSTRTRERAPERPASQRAVRRGSSDSRSGDRAAVRAPGSNASAGSDSVTRGRNRAAVPEYSRPRDGRNATGTAVERREPIPGNGGSIYYPGIYYPYDPFYSNYYGSYYSRFGYYPYSQYWMPGYGFGLGYFAYDPFMFGGGYGGYDYGGGYASGGYSSQYRDVGNIRLKVKPSNAQVYVDGYFVGVVDSFDGVFQKLGIESGAHRVELRAEGYETVQFEVLITPGETVTYKGELKPRIP